MTNGESAVQPPWRERLRTLVRFALGLAVGGLVIPCLGVVLVVAMFVRAEFTDLKPEPPPTPITVSVAGADVSRAGAGRVVLRQDDAMASLTCRGACDDLEVKGIDAPYDMQVVDLKGKTVASKALRWGYVLGKQRRWSLSGDPLRIVGSRP